MAKVFRQNEKTGKLDIAIYDCELKEKIHKSGPGKGGREKIVRFSLQFGYKRNPKESDETLDLFIVAKGCLFKKRYNTVQRNVEWFWHLPAHYQAGRLSNMTVPSPALYKLVLEALMQSKWRDIVGPQWDYIRQYDPDVIPVAGESIVLEAQ